MSSDPTGIPDGDSHNGRRPSVGWTAAALGVGFVVAIGIVLLLSRDDGASPADPASTTAPPTTVPLPRPNPANAAASIEFLDGAGAAVLVMHDAAAGLVDPALEVDATECGQTVSHLDDAAPADAMTGLIGRIPDAPLSASLEAERAELGQTLTACAAGDDTEPLGDRLDRLRQAVAVTDQRLGELRGGS